MTPKSSATSTATEPHEMGILDHLGELRRRLVYSVLFLFGGAAIAYSYSTEVFELLNHPFLVAFPGSTLIGTAPAEAFMVRLKVAFFAGALIGSPGIFAQIWGFVAPGLYPAERKLFLPFVAISTLLFAGGVALCYHFVLPVAYAFFQEQYRAVGADSQVRLSEHLSMMVNSLLGFGLVFELPVVAYFLARSGIINYRMLIRSSRYAIFAIFVVSAILTPPDVMSQFLMAGPLLVLYGVSILVVKFAERRPEPTAEEAPGTESSTQ